jgi:hypothetical protein
MKRGRWGERETGETKEVCEEVSEKAGGRVRGNSLGYTMRSSRRERMGSSFYVFQIRRPVPVAAAARRGDFSNDPLAERRNVSPELHFDRSAASA